LGDPSGASGGTGGDFTPPTYTTVVPTAFEGSYRDQLSPNELAVYDAVVALAVGACEIKPTLPEIPKVCQGRMPTESEKEALSSLLSFWITNALYAVWLDHPEIFWLELGKFTLAYSLEGDLDNVLTLTELTVTIGAAEGVTDAAKDAAALAAAIKNFTPTGKTVAQKVASINSYLCARITYDLNAPRRGNLLGALVDGKCVCEGYAQAFAYLAKRAGLDVVSIPGYAKANGKTEGHLWSAVRIDGVLYAMDVTWNDTTKSNVYTLVGTDTVCHEDTFAATHFPNSLAKGDEYKAFVFPSLSKTAYTE
jgi:transglutaminase-like putative cysteine protease